MRLFSCDVCGSRVAFENHTCLTCGAPLAYSVAAGRVVSLHAGPDGPLEFRHPGSVLFERRCANVDLAACNWLAEPDARNGLCLSCRLTRTRPNDSDQDGMQAFGRAEAAKRRLVYELLDLGLPVLSWMDDPQGLAVDLLSSRDVPVVTGHADGVITLDLAEGNDPHREALRVELGEPYRTLLGHVRHESGHYYWQLLAADPDAIDGFRLMFGDERADYGEAVQRHYSSGPPPGWGDDYVSSYATMHPWEDWAETFAHYLHLRDVLQTAQAYGLAVRRRADDGVGAGQLDGFEDLDAVGARDDVAELIARWLPLSYALNALNRSMGKADFYPFVLSPAVIAKLNAVHAGVLRVQRAGTPTLAGNAP